MTFYFDACLSKRIAKFIKELGVSVVTTKGVFGDDSVDDEMWMLVCGMFGWVIVTTDARIRKNPGQRKLLEALPCVTFFIEDRYVNLGIFAQASYMAGHWQRLAETAATAQPRTSFRMDRYGHIVESEEYERERQRKAQQRQEAYRLRKAGKDGGVTVEGRGGEAEGGRPAAQAPKAE